MVKVENGKPPLTWIDDPGESAKQSLREVGDGIRRLRVDPSMFKRRW